MKDLPVKLEDAVYDDFVKQCLLGNDPKDIARYILTNYTYGLEMIFSELELGLLVESINTTIWWMVQNTEEGGAASTAIAHLNFLRNKVDVYRAAAKGLEHESGSDV